MRLVSRHRYRRFKLPAQSALPLATLPFVMRAFFVDDLPEGL